MGRLESINTSRGGVPKRPVFEAFVAETGVSGDAQTNLQVHGGPDRAVVLYSQEVIRALQEEGHDIGVGTTGENLTVSGLEWARVVPGSEVRVGAVRLLITRYATPCSKIRGSFRGGHFMRIAQDEHPGWSRVCARVLEAGLVQPGDPVELVTPR
ncbi:MAG: MOSC domain-containing protein [Vicinamibacterales bacterium]